MVTTLQSFVAAAPALNKTEFDFRDGWALQMQTYKKYSVSQPSSLLSPLIYNAQSDPF
jgi:hypothetical protein